MVPASGTPTYMAPEQAAGHTSVMGPATDIYALGAIFYEDADGPPSVSRRISRGY